MDMLSISLTKNHTTPLYEQLYSFIKHEITSGRITFGTKLPSKRKLELHLKLSQTTIETAYEQLVAEGYIEARPRKGYFVLACEELAFSKRWPALSNSSKKTSVKNLFDYDFYPGSIDTSMFPYKKWRSLYREAISEENHELLVLGNAVGEKNLRNEIKAYLYNSRGVICSADQIIIGAGIEQLFSQLIFLLGEKAIYGIENPGYPLTSNVLKSHKRRSILVDVDSEGANVSNLGQTEINTMYVTPSHQFPYGSIMSANRRAQLLNWSHQQRDRFIIEDDYDSEFRYSGRTIPSLHSLGKGETVIYLSTFSKSLMPSLRIGYMVLPPALMAHYRKEFSHYASCVSRIDQYVLARFMMEGFFEKHLNRMRNLYRKKLETVVNCLHGHKNKVIISGEKAGLHLLLTFKEQRSEFELVQKAKAVGIRVCGLANFSHEGTTVLEPGIVLGFGGMAEKDLIIGIKKLVESWFD